MDMHMSDPEELIAIITQLQQQQSILTNIVAASLEGNWTGEGSVEAWLYALNPQFQGQLELDVPVTESQYIDPPKA